MLWVLHPKNTSHMAATLTHTHTHSSRTRHNITTATYNKQQVHSLWHSHTVNQNTSEKRSMSSCVWSSSVSLAKDCYKRKEKWLVRVTYLNLHNAHSFTIHTPILRFHDCVCVVSLCVCVCVCVCVVFCKGEITNTREFSNPLGSWRASERPSCRKQERKEKR